MENQCRQVFHQMEIVAASCAALISSIEESEWDVRPTTGKMSIGELAGHIALICEADRRIADGADEMEMSAFYASRTPEEKELARAELLRGLGRLNDFYSSLNQQQLDELCTSYWGAAYSRYGWLLETLVHLTHHRGQLHAMLVHSLGKELDIALFE